MGKNSKEKRCPNCRSSYGLENKKILILSFDNWMVASAYGLIIIAFASKFQIDGNLKILFILLAIIPVLISISNKIFCTNCGIEFQVNHQEKELDSSVLNH